MDYFTDLIRQRRSIRSFKSSRPVGKGELRLIIDAANLAPSAGNCQAYEIYMVVQQALKAKIAVLAAHQEWLSQAPLLLIFMANGRRSSRKYGWRGSSLYAIQDATLACSYAQLKAHDLGLATCWVGAFDDYGLRKALNAPNKLQPISILAVGYADETPEHGRTRRDPQDMLHVAMVNENGSTPR